MISNRLLLLCNITIFLSSNMYSATTQPMTPTQLNDHESIHIFTGLQLPINSIPATDKFTTQIFNNIDTTFGPKGMNLSSLQIQHIKNCYFYLIFLAKLNLVQTNANFKIYESDFQPYLTDNATATPHLPDQTLVTSHGWISIPVDAQTIIASPMWQLYCKSMICDIYTYFAAGLEIIENIEKEEFNYVPHFETSYYNQDYTNLRTINTTVRIKMLLENNVKNQYIVQTSDWKNLPLQSSSSQQVKNTTKQSPTLEQSVVAFRKSPFYQTTHNMHQLLGSTSSTNQNLTVAHQALLQAPQLKSPLKEFVFCYFMLYEMYGQVTNFITANNLATSLNALTESTLSPNIIPYTNQDFVLLNALLMTKSKAEGTHTISVHPAPKTFKPEDFRKKEDMPNPSRQPNETYMKKKLTPPTTPEVQAQSFLSFFSNLGDDIAHDVTSAFHAVVNGVVAAADSVANTLEAVGLGIAGMACKALFFVPSIAQEGENLSTESQTDFVNAANDLQNSVSDFSNSIKDGIIAPIGEVTGDLVGFVIQDQKIGGDVSSIIDSTAGAIVQVATEALSNVASDAEITIQAATDSAELIANISTLVAAGAVAIFSQQGRNDFLQTWHDTLQDCVNGLTSAYLVGMAFTKANIAAVMNAMGAVINSITTIFIDLSREITFIFMTVADATVGGIVDAIKGETYNPIAYANACKDQVTNSLEAHRQVINQVMGVVTCVAADAALDICTAGAGTPADAELDTMIMGAAEVASETGSSAIDVAQEAVSTAQDAVSDATDSVNTATENLTTATEQGNEEAINAAKESLQQAKEKLADAVEQQSKAATDLAQKQALQDTANMAKTDVQTFTEKAANALKEKFNNAIDSLKSVPKNLANVLKSNQELAEEAAETASTKAQSLQEATDAFNSAKSTLMDASQDSDTEAYSQAQQDLIEATKNLKQAQAESKEAEEFAQESANIAKESSPEKALRYLKNGFKVFKPLGLIMNVAFNFTMIISGYNQDEQNLLQQSQQSHMLQNLWTANTQMKISSAQTSLENLEETSLKQQAVVGNSTLGLALYQNYTYAFVNQYQQSILNALAPIYVIQLLPNSATGMIPGNIGTLWGVTTNYLNLYPSQGFYTTTTGRSDFPFAQEIAQSPRVTTQQGSTSTANKQWFNQRCTGVDAFAVNQIPKKPLDPLTVNIKMQILYVLNSEFYAGIYLGGDYQNYFSPQYIASLLNTSTNNIQSAFKNLQQALEANKPTTQYLNPSVIDLNEPYLAKMVVLYRNSATDSLKLGVYEYMGASEWLLQQELPTNVQLNQQHTYQINTTLNNDNLTINLFVDDNPTAIFTKTITVTPLQNQRMYGIIASGAAITWNQLTPQIQQSINTTARPAQTTTSEITRAKNARVTLANSLTPTFGAIKLTPLSKQAILFGQYVYASTNTDLQKIDPQHPADFLIFGSNNNGTITNLGKAPNSITDNNTNVLVSLITNHVFDLQGNVIKIIPNVWQTYQASAYGPFSPNLAAYITKEQQNVYSTLSKIKFGNFILNIIDQASLATATFIYTSSQTIQNNGKPVLDYLICTSMPDATSQLTLGLPPTSPNAQALLSLVSGNLYTKTTTVSTQPPTAIKTYDVISEFQKFTNINNISANDYTTIKNAQLAYIQSQAQQKKTTTKTPLVIPKAGSIQNLQPGQIAPKQNITTPPTSTGISLNFHPQANITARQQQAAGTIPFQFQAPSSTGSAKKSSKPQSAGK